MFHKNRLTLLAALAACTLTRAASAEPPAVLPYMADDVVAVACVDLDSLDVVPTSANHVALIQSFFDVQPRSLEEYSVTAGFRINQLREMGLGPVHILFRVDDVVHGGPTWFAPVKKGRDAKQLVAALKELLPRKPGNSTAWLPKHFAVVDGAILAATSKAQLEAFQKSRRDAGACRPDAKEAVSWCASHAAGFVLCADADSRRVLREMFPRLPEPFEKIDGPFLADSLRWAGMTVDFRPKLQVGAMIQMNNAESARVAQTATAEGLKLGKTFFGKEVPYIRDETGAVIVRALELIRPEAEQTAVVLKLGDNPEAVAALSDVLGRAAIRVASRNHRMNRFKQIGLGFWNYHDAYKTFPAAVCDKDGKPLLSWRVAVLPYLENNPLYKEFHLDEPWDSEHNLKLIKRMPAVFADPDPAVRKGVGDPFKTTYVVPTGEGAVFHGGKAKALKEVSDGLSSTVLAVETVPERAVIWTKPDDWEVDWKNPLDGIRRDDGRPFTCVFCDGSVHILRNNIDPKVWKKLLTAAGGEVVRKSEWEK